MTYITTCFYCRKSLKLRESIIVKQALSREILHKYHPDCYARLTEPVAQGRINYDETLEAMRNAHATAHL